MTRRNVTKTEIDRQRRRRGRKEERNGRGLKRAEGLEWPAGTKQSTPLTSVFPRAMPASARAQDCRSVLDSRSRERHMSSRVVRSD